MRAFILALALTFSVAVTGCQTEEADAVEDRGEAMDEAMEDRGDMMEEQMEDAGMEDRGEAIDEQMEDRGDMVEERAEEEAEAVDEMTDGDGL